MQQKFTLNEKYISRKFLFFRIADYKYTLRQIFRSTLQACLPYAQKYYLKLHDAQNPKADSAPVQGLCSELKQEAADKLTASAFAKGDNAGFFEFYLYQEDLKHDAVFVWSLGDFIYLNLEQEQFAKFQAEILKQSMPADLYKL